MNKKVVGRVINEVLRLGKEGIPSKQDSMTEISSGNMRNISKEFLSKKSPIQIKLLDSNNDPISAMPFSISSNDEVVTNGVTNIEGLCIYDTPSAMTMDVQSYSLEYEANIVIIELSEDATYTDIEITENENGEPSVEINDDSDPYKIAPEDYNIKNKWAYTLDDENDTIILKYYYGNETNVIVYANYIVDGKKYKTQLASNATTTANGVEYIFNGQGTQSSNCRNIISIIFSRNIDTSNVTNMSYMFYLCEKLKTLDISGFDTSNVEYMGDMFGNCWALQSLDLTNFDTSKVTDMNSMFWNCCALKTLDLSNFNTSNVTKMNDMFGVSSTLTNLLTELDLTSFDTSNVTYMVRMFGYCKKLKKVLVSRDKWDVSKANTSLMFNQCGCSAVTYVD